jgi:ABC-type transport system involved in cytochrome bd biosynthesis fused ATPase/permease subunit
VIGQLFLLIAISEGLEKQRIWPLYIMAGIYMIDVFVVHWLQLEYISQRLAGKAKSLLREKAIYTMLQLTMPERERIESGKAITTIISHVDEVVLNGWIAGAARHMY